QLLARRILEDAPVGSFVRRLRGLSLPLQVGDDRLDLVRRPGLEPELCARDDLAVAELGVAVAQAQLGRRLPARAVRIDDERTDEDRRPVASVRAGVHPDAAADSP